MATSDFVRTRLGCMANPRHPLAVLAGKMPWSEIEAALAPAFAHQDRKGHSVEGADMFGPTLSVAGASLSPAGRPRLPIRLMASLLYLKHAFDQSDEALVERWSESVVWQFFSGMEYYNPKLPCDAIRISRFRKILGEAGLEIQAVKKIEFERVIVDTVQEKAIAHPTDAQLLDVVRQIVVRPAKRAGIALKMTYEREGKTLRRRAGGYAHAKQFKCPKTVLKRQRTILGELVREVTRKMAQMAGMAADVKARLRLVLERAVRIRTQKIKDKNKLYAMHAPEAECTGKVRSEVAHIAPAREVGDETGRSVDRRLPVHALLATASCGATGTAYWAFGRRWVPRGNGVTCQHRGGLGARPSGMVNRSELLQASLCMTGQRC